MGIFDDDQGKTEQPTPTRLADVRNRGDTSLSRELVQGGGLLVAAIAFSTCGAWLVDSFAQVMRRGLDIAPHKHGAPTITGSCQEIGLAVWGVLPPFLTMVAIIAGSAAVLGYGQIGLRWSNEVLGFKIERLNPINNWKKVFNVQAIVRTAFAALKLGVLIGVLQYVLGDRWQGLLELHQVPADVAAAMVGEIAISLLLWVGVVTFLLAAADVFWQRFQFTKRNMMSKQEVEDERRRSEGDPTMKMRQRRARNDLLRHRMTAIVPKADVVITNPTHFAVALRYDRSRDLAPTVVAKGVDEMAQRIREIARENDVPLMEDPPLARALFRAVKVGQAIPERFYQAVATVLSHVYRLKGRTA
ncbi:MAG: flagellar biosynthesis protein FlhB [Planctomycetes bacterium]|nr:flagellar biosynthesis protein FlhB [Planctomycetota bacterium]